MANIFSLIRVLYIYQNANHYKRETFNNHLNSSKMFNIIKLKISISEVEVGIGMIKWNYLMEEINWLTPLSHKI